MSERGGIAEISFPPDQGWNLSPSGHANQLRYWAHIHFEQDADWGNKLWTVFVEPSAAPAPQLNKYMASIMFVAPDAPHHLISAGSRFNLCVGNLVKATGVVVRKFEN